MPQMLLQKSSVGSRQVRFHDDWIDAPHIKADCHRSLDLEAAAAEAGLPFAVIRSEEDWLATAHGQHLAELPIVSTRKVTDAPPKILAANPRRPLQGIKVICATHAIAGPSAAHTLAEHGVTVLQIMYTHGFEHDFV